MDQIFFEGWGGVGFGKFLRQIFFVTLEGAWFFWWEKLVQ